ncbi:hypothetical protein GOP47_0011770 [Adiantum capillus-veneris]|uniref:Uncharacterized protein n=1 Tax=Adiantum capillus-veneris TaxID=13818 RepID=A0A9D4UTU8_ADICA|nr:hypothetical protein GOP47_0011770 [Adiantum capillus-veneris]
MDFVTTIIRKLSKQKRRFETRSEEEEEEEEVRASCIGVTRGYVPMYVGHERKRVVMKVELLNCLHALVDLVPASNASGLINLDTCSSPCSSLGPMWLLPSCNPHMLRTLLTSLESAATTTVHLNFIALLHHNSHSSQIFELVHVNGLELLPFS